MENDFGVDLEGIFHLIDTADVIVVRFQIVEPRLLIDARTSDLDGPMIALVPRVNSAEERFRSLKQMRPRLPLPERIMSFHWPRQIATLQAAGIWPRLRERLIAAGGDGAGHRCDEVFRELQRQEREVTVGAIQGGEGYETLWERRP